MNAHLKGLVVCLAMFTFLAMLPSEAASSAKFWHPKISDTFQIQLSGALDTRVSAKIYDIDLFDTSSSQIALLKKDGHKVVCYFSAGSSENWRPDFAKFSALDMGRPLQGWTGENWLDIRSNNVRSVMVARIAFAAKKGCNGVDPDNVDGYSNPTGFALIAKDQIAYDLFLAKVAHSRGLAAGLKNDVGQVAELAPNFEFAVNEQCHQFGECSVYRAFTSLGKPVLNIEYQSHFANGLAGSFVALCKAARSEMFYTLVLPLLLDGTSRFHCTVK